MTDKEYLDRALDFIVNNFPEDTICELLTDIPEEDDFCAEHCEEFDRFCVMRFLKHYKIEKR